MFNLSGSEIIFLLLMGLVVLGPDRLPDAMRRAGKAYAEFKKMSTGFQSEMRSALDEPLRELRETADLAKNAAMFEFESGASTVTPSTTPTRVSSAEVVAPTIAAELPVASASEPVADAPVVDAPVPVERPPGPAFGSAAPRPTHSTVEPAPALTSFLPPSGPAADVAFDAPGARPAQVPAE